MQDTQKFYRYVRSSAVIVVSVLIVAASFGGGIYVGYQQRPAIETVQGILGQEPPAPHEEVNFNQFWDVWSRLEREYVDRADINRQKLIYGAITGMVKAIGDPYTVFLQPQQAKQFDEDVRGSFGGIGAEIGIRKDVLTIIAPLRGSPAERAGLKAGDRILKINATSTADLTIEEAVGFIRGEIGTKVVLAVTNDGFESARDVEITRETIVIPTVETSRHPNGIFRIHLLNFNEKSTADFRAALRELVSSGATKLVFDLRSNPGGYLEAAVDVASWFIPTGDVVARERFADGSETVYRSSGHRAIEAIPLVVLIDQGSASASEIVAGALRDVRGIRLIGEKTFGKGSVQQLDELSGGASLKVTVAKWLTPKGISINEKGIEPDIKVEATREDLDAGRDPQLERALEILKSL